ncbi:MAG: type II toxin-antitoxin system VapC family toxin [Microbacterium sp.]|uniref:type II toxin-antitoxin system VapC family toxin n=1 Tax=Microbacterium sp. TaxID=51671 RepID=UPI0039E4BD94
MIVDSSAIVAVVQGEKDAASLAALLIDENCRMSAVNWLEAAIVLDSRSALAQAEFEEALELAEVAIEPVTAAHARIAREAYRRFGRGTGHPARLNYGDCFAYALAISAGESLLFVGDDFSHTDIVPAFRTPGARRSETS